MTALAAGLLLTGAAAPVAADSHDDEPASFTSMFSVSADPDQVPDGGEPDATGRFDLRLDADSDTICFDIELDGVTPPYESAANTATHIHEGPVGEAGPPRVVFPDPEMHDDGTLTSTGCVSGPFITGAEADDGSDQGEGFTVADLEADPTAYYVDTHTTEFVAGAVRGQFDAPVPMGGMDTGDGSMLASTTSPAAGVAGLFGLLLATGLAIVSVRKVRGHGA